MTPSEALKIAESGIGSFPKTEAWIRKCFHEPKESEIILERCNELLEGYGIEAVFGDRCYWPEFSYVNFGETYAETVVCRYLDKWGESYRFEISSWGDMVEVIEAENGEPLG